MTTTAQRDASRAPPPRVPPVWIAGMRYAQVPGDLETDGQVGGILAAYDASNRQMWRLKVYENARRPEREGDVQDVWFRSLRVEGGSSSSRTSAANGSRWTPRPDASADVRRQLLSPSPTSTRSPASPASGGRGRKRRSTRGRFVFRSHAGSARSRFIRPSPDRPPSPPSAAMPAAIVQVDLQHVACHGRPFEASEVRRSYAPGRVKREEPNRYGLFRATACARAVLGRQWVNHRRRRDASPGARRREGSSGLVSRSRKPLRVRGRATRNRPAGALRPA